MDDHTKRFKVSAKYVAWAQSFISIAALLLPLTIAVVLGHRSKDKEESVAAVWSFTNITSVYFPEKPLYQILKAVDLGPRIFSVVLWAEYAKKHVNRPAGMTLLVLGIARTICSLLHTFVLASDDEYIYDMSRSLYLCVMIIWMHFVTLWTDEANTMPNTDSSETRGIDRGSSWTNTMLMLVDRPRRRWLFWAYVIINGLAMHFSIQYHVYLDSSAYSKYYFLEWLCLFTEIAFDFRSGEEFETLRVTIDYSPQEVNGNYREVSDKSHLA